jgi:putative heme-binding domain-containing protein
MKRAAFYAVLGFSLAFPAFGELDHDDPEAELASFRLPPGFEANLFASERDGVVKPIQIRWDARGRLWVIQSTTYPQLIPGEIPNDKVLILEDTEHTGHADKVTVFADHLMIPTGLELAPVAPFKKQPGSGASGAKAPGQGTERFPSACYVGEGTKLWLLTDTTGEGRADRREIVLRGFGTGDTHQNINSFRWSPGGDLMFSQGLHGHARVETPYGIVPLDAAGFWRFRPLEQRVDAFYGGHAEPQNPWGFAWTHWGQMLMVAGNNGGIYFPLPEMIRGFQGGRREQIWVNARSRKCSGPEIIGSSHLPPEWQGVMLSGGYINNVVWSLKIEEHGAGFQITDLPPLVVSTHGSFRPVDIKLGPDGAIYLCDWYNPIIGHYQASFRHPDRDKAHGRIWRITYKGRPLVQPPVIAGAPLESLLENLKSSERWVVEQSRRELAARDPKAVAAALATWIAPMMRVPIAESDAATEHALHEALAAYETQEIPAPELLTRLLKAREPGARAFATGVLGRWAGRLSFDVFPVLAGLARDPDPRVRLEAVVAAGNLPDAQSVPIVLDAPNPDGDKFLELGARTAVAVLQPQVDALLAKGAQDWKPAWRARLAALQLAPTPSKPAASTAPIPAAAMAVPAYGKLRATTEYVAAMVQEVREKGDAKRGSDVFHRADMACMACHSVDGKGGTVGPALDAIGSGQPLDFIIGAVLEPQREIKESYEAIQITAKDGRSALGYIVARNSAGATIRDPFSGAETHFAAADIAAEKQIGSLMPAGLVDALPRDDLRDLFRYLSELGKPKP